MEGAVVLRLGRFAAVGAEEVLDVGEEELGEITGEVLEILRPQGDSGLGADMLGKMT